MPRPKGSKNNKPAGVRVNAIISAEAAQWLKGQSNMSKIINQLVEDEMNEHFKIVWDEGCWVRLQDAAPMLDGSPRKWDGHWGIWSSDNGIMPDFYFQG